jgi:hypothetical protein
MIALILGTYTPITPLILSSFDTESAIKEIILNHRNLLIESGLTPEWLDQYAYDELDFCDPQWEANIRIYTWYACYSQYESDDQIVTAYIADTSRSTKSHTSILFASTGESLIFEYDETSQNDIRRAVYGKIREGLLNFTSDTQEAFSPAWVDQNQNHMPIIENLMKGLRFCQLEGDSKHEEFNSLQLYLIENQN